MSRWLLLSLCLLVVWTTPCFGVIILEKGGGSEPIKGFLVSQNEARVVIDELLPSGETRQRVFPRSAIDVMIISVASDRLEALQPDQPQAYRDYADELAEKREDPEARRTAIRLYLLAAYLDPPGQGRSSLLSMAGLARSPNEERRFRAMVYLLDPAHDRGVLKPPSFAAATTTNLTDSQRTMLLTAIRALRSGDRREALNYSRRPLFQEAMKRYASVLTPEEFGVAAADRDKALSGPLLGKLITLELLLLNLPLRDQPAMADVPWTSIVATRQDTPVTPLSLETITEFDPAESVFKDNRWTVAK